MLFFNDLVVSLFGFMLIFSNTYVNSYCRIHTIHVQYVAIRRDSSSFPHRRSAQWEKPPWGADEPRFELRLALQQADALPSELLYVAVQKCSPDLCSSMIHVHHFYNKWSSLHP